MIRRENIICLQCPPLRGYKGRHEWFWEPGDEAHVFPIENLMGMYEKSVGHNSTLILGLTPDDRGLIPSGDSLRLAEFGDAIKAEYGNPLKSTSGEGNKYEVKFKSSTEVSRFIIQEDKRIAKLDKPVNVSAVCLKINDSLDKPLVKNFSLF